MRCAFLVRVACSQNWRKSHPHVSGLASPLTLRLSAADLLRRPRAFCASGILCSAGEKGRWITGPVQMGVRDSRKEQDALGGRGLQTHDEVSPGIPDQASQMPIHTTALSPQRLPLGDRLPQHSRRGQGMEAIAYDHAALAGYSDPARRAEHPGPSAARGF